MIRFDSVKKYYATRCVLDIPELTLSAGRRYALIGPNGSGKSTLLRLLSGTLRPEQGGITIDGARDRDIGYMPQRPYAYGFSVLRNVEMAVKARGPAAREPARKALEEVGMSALLNARGNALSGGEAQRMAFARMIVEKRRLLLLDEPTSAMDIPGTRLVEQALMRYWEVTGCTLLFATHALSQAERLADEVILMMDGQIAARGPAEDVLYAPEDERAAAFIRFWQLERPAGAREARS